MPEVIIIDEIGRELEAAGRPHHRRARRAAGRHSPRQHPGEPAAEPHPFGDLVGGIQAVTLSDEEARRRARKRRCWSARHRPPLTSWSRSRTGSTWPCTTTWLHRWMPCSVGAATRPRYATAMNRARYRSSKRPPCPLLPAEEAPFRPAAGPGAGDPMLRVYAYGVGKNRLRQAAQNLHLPVELTEELRRADGVITLKSYYRRRPQPITEAERRGVPIYVLRSNTVSQMESCLADIFGLRCRRAGSDGPSPCAKRRTPSVRCSPARKPQICLRRIPISAASSTRWRARPTWSLTAMARIRAATCASLAQNGDSLERRQADAGIAVACPALW
jgi:hypothetical protein